jgi:hypothetical protein
VTTNYDLVFERCASKNSDMPADTGFRKGDGYKYLPLQKIVLEDQFHQIEYVKLHGSINWWIRDRDKMIVQRDEPKPRQASNIIITDVAESKNIKAFTFVEFFKIGTLVTLANIGIYYLFITYL